MTRLVIFLLMMASIIGVLALNSFKDEAISTTKFDYKSAKKTFNDRKAEIAGLNNPQESTTKKVAVAKITEIVLDTPELKSGHKLYKKCIACHGQMGNGKKAQKAPKIAGQYAWYLVKQLEDMRSQVRVNKVMFPFVKRLSDQDISHLSLYISKLPW